MLSEDFSTETPAIVNVAAVAPCTPTATANETIVSMEIDEKYKHQLFKLLKQARLAEIDYARREHEQKLRFEQSEQELKMSYYRQQQDLKLRQMREEHDTRMRQQRREHEARLSVYNHSSSGLNGNGDADQQLAVQEQAQMGGAVRCNAKTDYNNLRLDSGSAQSQSQLQPQPSTSSSSSSSATSLALNANSLAFN